MKETGIIMSGNHPKLILEGLKTQTRRVIKPQPAPDAIHACNWRPGGMACGEDYFRERAPYHCPYGQVGDRLWVRETYCAGCAMETPRFACYKASANPELWPPCVESIVKPSLFMPRWASRILLEITELRVERLQEISTGDIWKEGVILTDYIRHDFQRLWDSLNAKRGYGWEVNPWVWVISFKLLSR